MIQHDDERQPLLSLSLKSKKDPPGPHEISNSTRIGILSGVWLASFLFSFNQTLVPTMLALISSEFRKSHQASWLGTAYLLATCTFTPLFGSLCNVLGRKGAYKTALFLAAAGCTMCGFSTSMEMLILARFLAGMGGGGILTTSSIVVSDMYSSRSRGLAQGVAMAFNGLGQGLGGPFGGIVTDWLGWRWAFLLQIPLFALAYVLTDYNLYYVTEGKGKSTKEVLKRIDYGGSVALMSFVGSILFFLSERFNQNLPWGSPTVVGSIAAAIVSIITFLVIELYIAPEPIMAPYILKQRIPRLVGASNFLVANCNLTVMYFFPLWFQTVMLSNASTAGAHLLPNSLAVSAGSLFAGWIMYTTGKYKRLNSMTGILPFIGVVGILMINENSGIVQSWFSVIPVGFGNAIAMQTSLIALLAHLPESHVALGTGFGTLFRGVGQVGGVAISSAIFQSRLTRELHTRITGPNAEELITRIKQQSNLVVSLPPDVQRAVRDAHSTSIKAVFVYAACLTLVSYAVRLAIPEKELDSRPSIAEPPEVSLPADDESEREGSVASLDTDVVVVRDEGGQKHEISAKVANILFDLDKAKKADSEFGSAKF
ncbi:hypothetical protein AGABI1DRAFT_111711 [Agaricus bisporus var. burnettii JB137-S8]|uniref:Major facilitator superfamily (MFS) profile domain-containing protein n=1 Tax=Agaricus bisporus var. burnettii (strain JB137-S8 / ATCC MYA-4627 / FGSC 10392) TaxID=597362 RepID=K5XIX1_AGABU|nr:uncharacterized protein AGABI1DRAFT_111711 [Agaricus bisporus var. burnettii JB137-S8]EKM83277.1 hypothetical protein AGABI1DRAFT_111711 [Agaricus bisporus var. burnettii JB137-S8]